MSDSKPPKFDPDDPAPFGTRPARSAVPLWALGFLYFACLGALLWMAMFHTVQR